MLQVVDLACRRGDRRLFSGLSFALEPGTLLHVRGRNGSGKTTLLRALCGLFTPEAGAIHWQGEDSRASERYRADLLYCGHLNGIKGDLTGLENLRIAATLDDNPVEDERLWSALAQMGLAGGEDLPTRALSQGQKRRVALARLLVSRAPLWLLDEPFSALDTDAVDLLRRLIAERITDGGLVVLTSHQEIALASGRVRHLYLGDYARESAGETVGEPDR